MKKTHLSTGVYDQSWRRYEGQRVRVKHTTACHTIADHTKATTERTKVTCRICLRKGAPS
jgi:hypothetical protein